MSTRAVLVSAGLLVVVCGGASSQPQPIPGPAITPPGFVPPGPSIPPPGVVPPVPVAQPMPPPPTPPPEKSVDDLLNELERVQAQKAALEKAEQALKAILRTKLEQQTERLNKLGVAPPPRPAEPDRVGQILIEGNTKTPDKKILEVLGMSPGQVLQYPKLKAARTKLVKAGFPEASVEGIPSEFGSPFVNIRVRVSEPEPIRPELRP